MVWWLGKFLLQKDFIRENLDSTLFLNKENDDLLVVQINIDDIIIGITNDLFCHEFAELI